MKRKLFETFAFLLLSFYILNAQSVRGLVNDGVDAYEEDKYSDAEVNFKKGIENDIENFESRFNLGDAIYKQGRYDEALEEFKNSLNLVKTDEEKAKIFHNIGNTFLKSQKLQESIASYKESLKLNPNDLETKYNLSFALKQMQDQQNQQNQQNQNNQDQNQENQDQQQDQQNQDQPQDQQKQEQKEQNQQPQPQEQKDEISKDEAQRILDALKNNEAELQKKMREQKSKKSNVEKDW